jgi:hypothetical protein
MSMIYALVARGKEVVLSDFTPFSGNFPNVALDVPLSKNLGSKKM